MGFVLIFYACLLSAAAGLKLSGYRSDALNVILLSPAGIWLRFLWSRHYDRPDPVAEVIWLTVSVVLFILVVWTWG